ncbi:hypothetical protein HanPI659440_Chr01g0007861 [Helianthus annuus]|nr:hypothetical protein HanPI659440_Chr01g0007861 [Helianthus annuus]
MIFTSIRIHIKHTHTHTHISRFKTTETSFEVFSLRKTEAVLINKYKICIYYKNNNTN